VIFLSGIFHKNPSKGLEVEKIKYFSKKMQSPGVVTPLKIMGPSSHNMHIYNYDLSLYQLSLKSIEEFRRNCKDIHTDNSGIS
jgi:hypothetical protein